MIWVLYVWLSFTFANYMCVKIDEQYPYCYDNWLMLSIMTSALTWPIILCVYVKMCKMSGTIS